MSDSKKNSNSGEFICLAAVIAAALALYAQTLQFEFVYDDIDYILKNSYINGSSFTSPADAFIPGAVRGDIYIPFTVLLWTSLFSIFGKNAAAFHMVSVLSYLLSIISLWSFLGRISKGRMFKFVSVLLFALHPIHTECVAWISALGYSLSAACCFMSLRFFADYIDADGHPLGILFSSLLFCISSMMFQPAGAVVPMLMVAYAISLRRERLWKGLAASFLPFVSSACFCILFYMTVKSSERFSSQVFIPAYDKLETAGHSLLNLIWPSELTPVYPAPCNAVYILALFAIAGLCVYAAYADKSRLAAFLSISLACSYLPYSNLLYNIHSFMNDRYMMLPSFASCALIAFASERIYDKFKEKSPVAAIAPAVAAALICLCMSVCYIPVWRNELTLWSYAYSRNPSSEITAGNLSFILFALDEKEALLKMAEGMNHSPAVNHIKLKILNECAPASEAVRFAENAGDDTPLFRIYRSCSYMKAGLPAKALREIDDLERNPGKEAMRNGRNGATVIDEYNKASLKAYYLNGIADKALLSAPDALGGIYEVAGRPDMYTSAEGLRAVSGDLKRSLASMDSYDPMHPASIVLHTVSLIMLRGNGSSDILRKDALWLSKAGEEIKKGRKMEALSILKKITDSDPFCCPALIQAGRICLSEGMRLEAEEFFNKASETDPSFKAR